MTDTKRHRVDGTVRDRLDGCVRDVANVNPAYLTFQQKVSTLLDVLENERDADTEPTDSPEEGIIGQVGPGEPVEKGSRVSGPFKQP